MILKESKNIGSGGRMKELHKKIIKGLYGRLSKEIFLLAFNKVHSWRENTKFMSVGVNHLDYFSGKWAPQHKANNSARLYSDGRRNLRKKGQENQSQEMGKQENIRVRERDDWEWRIGWGDEKDDKESRVKPGGKGRSNRECERWNIRESGGKDGSRKEGDGEREEKGEEKVEDWKKKCRAVRGKCNKLIVNIRRNVKDTAKGVNYGRGTGASTWNWVMEELVSQREAREESWGARTFW